MPYHLDNSFEVSAAGGQENPFADPTGASGENPFAERDSQENPFADPSPALKNNPFLDSVEAAKLQAANESEFASSIPTTIAGKTESFQSSTGFDLPPSSQAQETTAIVSQESAPNDAAGFDWLNPAYLLGMIPLLLLFMAWRWMVEDSEFGESRSKSKSKSKSRSKSRSKSGSRSKYESASSKSSSGDLAATGKFRKVENFPVRPKPEVSPVTAESESDLLVETKSNRSEDALLFGEDKEREFDRITAANSLREFYESDDRDLSLSDHGSELQLKLKALRLEKKELALLLESMRTQLDSTIRLQQQYESDWQHLQSRLHDQLETKDVEKGEMQRLLKSTSGATETVTALVTEFQRQLDSTKSERQNLRELLDKSEVANQSLLAQRNDFERLLEESRLDNRELQERVKTAELASESTKLQLDVFQQQLESTKQENSEIKELLKSTAGATETISTLVVELQHQLESTKLENSELQGRLKITEESQDSNSQNVVELKKQLDQKSQTIASLELQVAQAQTPKAEANGSRSNGASDSAVAGSQEEAVGPAVRRKFTKLYRAYERERNLRKASEAQLAKTDEHRLNVAKTLEGIKQELTESPTAKKSQPVSQFAAEKRELSEKIAALHSELLHAQNQASDPQGS